MLDPTLRAALEELHTAATAAHAGNLGELADVISSCQTVQKEAESSGESLLIQVARSLIGAVNTLFMNNDDADSEALFLDVQKTAEVLKAAAEADSAPQAADLPTRWGLGATAADAAADDMWDAPDPEILAEFLGQQKSQLESMESDILALEQADAGDRLGNLRHVLHTMKGDSGFLGLHQIERLCHTTEAFLEEQQHPVDGETLLAVKDWLDVAHRDLTSSGAISAKADTSLAQLMERLSSGAQTEATPPVENQPAANLPGASDDSAIVGELVDDALMATAGAGTSPVQGSGTPSPNLPGSAADAPVVAELLDDALTADAAAPAEAQIDRFELTGDPTLLADFISESREHLANVSSELLACEQDPDSQESVNGVFRAFHTLKGVAGFLDLAQIKNLAHTSEHLLDQVRKGSPTEGSEWVDLTFEALDMMERLISFVSTALASGESCEWEPALPQLLDRLQAAAELIIANAAGGVPTDSAKAASAPSSAPAPSPAPAPVSEASEAPAAASAVAAPAASPAASGDENERLTFDVAGGFSVPKSRQHPYDELLEVPLSKEQLNAQAAMPADPPPANPPVSAAPAQKQAVEQAAPAPARLAPARLAPRTAEAPKPAPQAAKAAPVHENGSAAGTPVVLKETIRVDYERLEALINAVGELVLSESMLSQDEEILAIHSETVDKKLYNLRMVTRKLQEMGTSIRMVPVAGTFQKMARLVRDVARKSSKPVNFSTRGEETELDRAFVDKIADPLVYMVRNAVDHGIEPPDEREANGKPREGNIELRAFHMGGNIHVEIKDDGRGLDRDAILAKAIDKGLLTEQDRPSDQDIYQLIFHPGFSTAAKVTEVSGRGVGMDVVRRNIEELRGHVQITTEHGKGSTFKIILPLTMALIDGMTVRVGPDRFIFPVLGIVESFRPRPDQVNTIVGKGELLSLRDRQIPLFRLYNLFGIPDGVKNPSEGLVVVVESDTREVGILVDDLVGMQQTVIKSLGSSLNKTGGLAGGAILGDGRVGLIIDVPGLIRVAHGDAPLPVPGAPAGETGPLTASTV